MTDGGTDAESDTDADYCQDCLDAHDDEPERYYLQVESGWVKMVGCRSHVKRVLNAWGDHVDDN